MEHEPKTQNPKPKIATDGLLVIDKPAGWTSHDVVARARRLLREKRVGHTGTLDPFATGVLVVLVGRATRLAQFLSGAEKEYEATVRFGYKTETGDLTGAPLSPVEPSAARLIGIDESEFERALSVLRGEIDQVPPMYSAKKVQGRKLYELARRGEEIERAAVRVTVREFEIERGESGELVRPNGDGTCDARARVVCSAGTYVRVLAEQLGERLGVGAHLTELRRTRAGSFRVSESVTLERLQELAEGAGAALIPMNVALPAMPSMHLTAEDERRVLNGVEARAPQDAVERWLDGAPVRMLGAGGELLAVGVYDARRGRVRPRVGLGRPAE
ncbi:MAG TPA: tRNA pseudouridine(55) synthase TruB [Pyrinomonadaceae bacterium]